MNAFSIDYDGLLTMIFFPTYYQTILNFEIKKLAFIFFLLKIQLTGQLIYRQNVPISQTDITFPVLPTSRKGPLKIHRPESGDWSEHTL